MRPERDEVDETTTGAGAECGKQAVLSSHEGGWVGCTEGTRCGCGEGGCILLLMGVPCPRAAGEGARGREALTAPKVDTVARQGQGGRPQKRREPQNR